MMVQGRGLITAQAVGCCGVCSNRGGVGLDDWGCLRLSKKER